MRRGEWHGEAWALKAENPLMTNTEIGRRLGVTQGAVWKVLNPEKTRELNRRSNADPARHAAKLAWANENDRAPCPQCGGLMHARSRRDGRKSCWDCYATAHAERRDLMVRLRIEGLKNVEIAARLGTSAAAVANALCRERKDDPSIPVSPHYREKVAA